MKILQIVDVPDWAINRLAAPVVKHNPHFDWRVQFVHPKALERGELDLTQVRKDIAWCDIIDANYWRSLSQLAELIPELKQKKVVLTHHNQKNILSENWDYVDVHVATTKYSKKVLEENYPNAVVTEVIYNSYNPDEFKFNDEFPPETPAIGYVGRIVPWKGMHEIARAAYELGYPVKFMGKIDKTNYWHEMPEEHIDNIDVEYMDCPDEERKNFYKDITCYVGFSGSGRETGPLGLIEAMASGVPVVTTPAGIAEDICEDQENSIVVDFDDYDELKESLKNLLDFPQLQQRIRKAGWDTIRNLTHEKRALKYRKVFNRLYSDIPLVSVIVPFTADRVDNVHKILEALDKQTYPNIEAVVIEDETRISNDEFTKVASYNVPVKHLCTFKEGYNLAMARNLGVIEADGRYLVFCDSRLLPDPSAIAAFVTRLEKAGERKVWLFGDKGSGKNTFVENFSAIRRSNFIKAGMCCERIDGYGGMSQELRERFASQGFEFDYTPEVKATEQMTARKDTKRRDDIIRMKTLLAKLYG